MKKLTELEKLKYWVDAEFTIVHIMFAIVMLQLTEGWLPTLFFSLYILFSLVYTVTRISYISVNDKDYLRIPKK